MSGASCRLTPTGGTFSMTKRAICEGARLLLLLLVLLPSAASASSVEPLPSAIGNVDTADFTDLELSLPTGCI